MKTQKQDELCEEQCWVRDGHLHATEKEIDQAREEYSTDEIAIDDRALVSRAEGGTWVQAWVFLVAKDDE